MNAKASMETENLPYVKTAYLQDKNDMVRDFSKTELRDVFEF